jgi:hypothetical protein
VKRLALAGAAMALLGVPAAAGAVTHAPLKVTKMERMLAAHDCREESFDDPAEFRFTYGRGQQALARCIRSQIREARWDCRQEAREDPFDYRLEYGTGARALRRCVLDELS